MFMLILLTVKFCHAGVTVEQPAIQNATTIATTIALDEDKTGEITNGDFLAADDFGLKPSSYQAKHLQLQDSETGKTNDRLEDFEHYDISHLWDVKPNFDREGLQEQKRSSAQLVSSPQNSSGGFYEEFHKIQFSWLEILIAILATLGIVLVVVNVAVVIHYCTHSKHRNEADDMRSAPSVSSIPRVTVTDTEQGVTLYDSYATLNEHGVFSVKPSSDSPLSFRQARYTPAPRAKSMPSLHEIETISSSTTGTQCYSSDLPFSQRAYINENLDVEDIESKSNYSSFSEEETTDQTMEFTSHKTLDRLDGLGIWPREEYCYKESATEL